MLDLRAMADFGETLGIPISYIPYKLRNDGTKYARVAVTHRKAFYVTQQLYPYLLGTDKGDQMLQALEDCGATYVDGIIIPRKRAVTGMYNNQNAKGHHSRSVHQ
jgi:hypothetical protein